MNYLTQIFFARLLYVSSLTGSLLFLTTCNHSVESVEVKEETDARIIPGKSVDGIKLGDSRDTVEAKLGRPDGIGWTDGKYRGWRFYAYNEGPHAGLTIDFLDYISTLGPVDMFTLEKTYTGKTKEGIGIGSSLITVRRIYGISEKTFARPENNYILDIYCFNGRHLNFGYTDSLVTGMNMGYFLPIPQDPDNPCK